VAIHEKGKRRVVSTAGTHLRGNAHRDRR
jgi:hypothetical protein